MATWPAFACASGQSECELGSREGLVTPQMPALAGLLESGSAQLWHLGKRPQAQKGTLTTPSVPSPRLVPPCPRDEEAVWALHFPHLARRGRGWMQQGSGGEQSVAQHPQQGEQPCPAQAAPGAPVGLSQAGCSTWAQGSEGCPG